MALYSTIPEGVTWEEIPSVFTPRVTAALLFGVLMWYCIARLAVNHRYEVVEKGASIRDAALKTANEKTPR